nr:MAG TPA: hypothetical protein [Bacteriophage sp.]
MLIHMIGVNLKQVIINIQLLIRNRNLYIIQKEFY